MEVKPIAVIKTDFKEKFGIPRQSRRVNELEGKIIFNDEYRIKEAFRGLENYSHLWLIFDFSLSHREDFSPTVRPPRLGGNKRVGVFASRSPFRPNPIGLSCVEIKSIESTKEYGTVITVLGIDLLDNTPILDIKPYIPYTDCVENAKGSFSEDYKNHKLDVSFSEDIFEIIPKEKRKAIIECIADDPRPSYQNDKDKIYKMQFDIFDVHFKIDENVATIIEIEKRYEKK